MSGVKLGDLEKFSCEIKLEGKLVYGGQGSDFCGVSFGFTIMAPDIWGTGRDIGVGAQTLISDMELEQGGLELVTCKIRNCIMSALEHEMHEQFKYDGKIIENPHE